MLFSTRGNKIFLGAHFKLHREENHYALRDLKTYVKIFYQNYPRF